MAESLLLISQFQSPSLHSGVDFATQDTICFAFSHASELGEGVLGKTRILKHFVSWVGWWEELNPAGLPCPDQI